MTEADIPFNVWNVEEECNVREVRVSGQVSNCMDLSGDGLWGSSGVVLAGRSLSRAFSVRDYEPADSCWADTDDVSTVSEGKV